MMILLLGGCAGTPRAHLGETDSAHRPAGCDTRGVWRVSWGGGSPSADDLEITFDPDLMRVVLDPALGRTGLVTGIDPAACRASALQREEVLRGAEGYEDEDVTLRFDFVLGEGPQAVHGTERRIMSSPPADGSYSLSGIARRQADWTKTGTDDDL